MMKDMNIDYAMICMDGVYNMGPDEASEVADIIQPRVVIPIHTAGSGLFSQENIDAFTYKEVFVLNVKDSIMLYD